MKKYIPKHYPGTEYVRLSELPIDQAVGLSKWLRETDYYTINSFSDCVHADEYEFWLDHFKNDIAPEEFALF